MMTATDDAVSFTTSTSSASSSTPTSARSPRGGGPITQVSCSKAFKGRTGQRHRHGCHLGGLHAAAGPRSSTGRRRSATCRGLRPAGQRCGTAPGPASNHEAGTGGGRGRPGPACTRGCRRRARSRPTGWAPGCCRAPSTGSARSARRRRRCATDGSRCPTRCRSCPAPASPRASSRRPAGCSRAPPGGRAARSPRRDLAWVRLTFWGFDDRRHTGELLVNRSVAGPLVTVFHRLYDARFPIEQMRITTQAEQDAPPTGDGKQHGRLRVPSGARRDRVLPARLRTGRRREPVPEPATSRAIWCSPSSPRRTATAAVSVPG